MKSLSKTKKSKFDIEYNEMNESSHSSNSATMKGILYLVSVTILLISLILACIAFSRSVMIGQTGPTGDQGIPGIQGLPGSDGINGTNGINGSQGPTGNQGPVGQVGSLDVFSFAANPQTIPTNLFYTVNFTLPIVNSTLFDGSTFTAPTNGTYTFYCFLTLQVSPSVSAQISLESALYINEASVMASTYLNNNSVLFIYTTSFYYIVPMNTGDKANIRISTSASAGTLTTSVEQSSYIIGSRVL